MDALPGAEPERLLATSRANFHRPHAALQAAAAGEPLWVAAELSKVDWVRRDMVVEVSHAEWTPYRLSRHVVDLGEREDKPAIDVRLKPSRLEFGEIGDRCRTG